MTEQISPLILVVDDYQDAREMYAEYLQFSGFRVAEARNGNEAVEQALALKPDLILMDLSLPGMDGWEATRRLKADETTGSSGIKDLEGLPDRQVMLISSAQQSALLSRPVLGGYLEQTAPEPADGSPEMIPAPDDGSIGSHMAYAVQWWLFAAGVPVGWVILVRREKRDREQAAQQGDGPLGGGEQDRRPHAEGRASHQSRPIGQTAAGQRQPPHVDLRTRCHERQQHREGQEGQFHH